MIVGYARVSTEEQRLDLQLEALEKAGCHRIFQDHGQSGQNFDREGLEKALCSLQPGGTLVVWRLDRLGRSLSGLVEIIDGLGRRKVNFRSIMENIDTHSAGGRLMFHLMASLAEFERTIISERTTAGLLAARSRGVRLGRPKALTDEQVREVIDVIHRKDACVPDLARRLNISERTLRRYAHSIGQGQSNRLRVLDASGTASEDASDWGESPNPGSNMSRGV
ncbi:recombinase family protein [Ciceribacter sp. RN22]|uniref:recombinase family protein n=1 Tax=Ciceribacter sp. RN22 TaxID=2954932 RepID=UPI0020930D92|nr:recombinase family protein [Ciceribacter sp. RN22]MCO6180902.1 recombinase family protein [Ciceribacter sp. RN22]